MFAEHTEVEVVALIPDVPEPRPYRRLARQVPSAIFPRGCIGLEATLFGHFVLECRNGDVSRVIGSSAVLCRAESDGGDRDELHAAYI